MGNKFVNNPVAGGATIVYLTPPVFSTPEEPAQDMSQIQEFIKSYNAAIIESEQLRIKLESVSILPLNVEQEAVEEQVIDGKSKTLVPIGVAFTVGALIGVLWQRFMH